MAGTLKELGATIVAITPQLAEASRSLIEKQKISFDLLSDPGNAYAAKLGLRFALPDDLKALKLATVAWLKQPLRSWLAKAEAQVPVTMAAVSANYTLPAIAIRDDSRRVPAPTTRGLRRASPTRPLPETNHTAVWTGSEMIVWGGSNGSSYFNTGGRYNPSTDSWIATSTTNAPAARDVTRQSGPAAK